MKIAIDGRFYGLENAGLGRYTIGLVENLKTLDQKNSYTILLTEKYFQKLSFPKNWKKIAVSFRHYSLKEQLELPKIINQENPDLVHFLHFNIPITYKGKFVVTIHDLLMHRQKGKEATTLPFLAYKIKRLAYHLVFKKAVFGSRKIIVPSNFVKEDLVNYYRIPQKKIEVVYEGVDHFLRSVDAGKKVLNKYQINLPYFIYSGNAYPHKNLKRAVEAIYFLNKASSKRFLFVIVSSRNVFVKRLERMIKSIGGEKYVRLIGFVPDNDLVYLYKNSLGFLYPSLSEGFGLPGLEAMAAGTLVLVSDIPVFHEIYENQAIYFNPYDFSAIEREMRNVVEMDPKKRQKLISSGQKFVKRYSWIKMAKKTLKIYKDVLEN